MTDEMQFLAQGGAFVAVAIVFGLGGKYLIDTLFKPFMTSFNELKEAIRVGLNELGEKSHEDQIKAIEAITRNTSSNELLASGMKELQSEVKELGREIKSVSANLDVMQSKLERGT